MFDLIDDVQADIESGTAVITFNKEAMKQTLSNYVFFCNDFGLKKDSISLCDNDSLESMIIDMADYMYEKMCITNPAVWVESELEIYECYKEVYEEELHQHGPNDRRTKYSKFVMESSWEEVMCFCV